MNSAELYSSDVEKILFHESTILSRLDEIAWEITQDYRGKPLTAVAVLHGGMIFMADLLRRVHLPLRIQTINVASYHGETTSSGEVTFQSLTMPDIEGQHVLLLDDILDSGRTLHAIGKRLSEGCGALSVSSCVLLQKRKERAEEVEADYVGFEIGDEFVIGYGLDYDGRYRNLPFVGTLKPELVGQG